MTPDTDPSVWESGHFGSPLKASFTHWSLFESQQVLEYLTVNVSSSTSSQRGAINAHAHDFMVCMNTKSPRLLLWQRSYCRDITQHSGEVLTKFDGRSASAHHARNLRRRAATLYLARITSIRDPHAA